MIETADSEDASLVALFESLQAVDNSLKQALSWRSRSSHKIEAKRSDLTEAKVYDKTSASRPDVHGQRCVCDTVHYFRYNDVHRSPCRHCK